MKIFTVTMNTAIDVVVSEKDYTDSGLDKAEMIPAGKGINVSRALKSASVCSVAIALVGEDDMTLFNSLECAEIETVFIPVSGKTRKNITLTHCEDGKEHHDRTSGFSAGDEELGRIRSILTSSVSEGDWVIFSGSLPVGMCRDAYGQLIRLCNKLGAYTLLDSSGEALVKGCEASPYAIKPNYEELKELVGNEAMEENTIYEVLKMISESYKINLVLATMSETGAKLYSSDADRIYSATAIPADDIVSSVGCGDCSVAGFVSALIDHMDYQKCIMSAMLYANANLFTPVPGDLVWG